MAKFSGNIGFGYTSETTPGVWTEQIVERHYTGDLLSATRSMQSSGNQNDDISLSNRISIVADEYLNVNASLIRYVTYRGAKWKVTNVDIKFPRLILSMGGVYNER